MCIPRATLPGCWRGRSLLATRRSKWWMLVLPVRREVPHPCNRFLALHQNQLDSTLLRFRCRPLRAAHPLNPCPKGLPADPRVWMKPKCVEFAVVASTSHTIVITQTPRRLFVDNATGVKHPVTPSTFAMQNAAWSAVRSVILLSSALIQTNFQNVKSSISRTKSAAYKNNAKKTMSASDSDRGAAMIGKSPLCRQQHTRHHPTMKT